MKTFIKFIKGITVIGGIKASFAWHYYHQFKWCREYAKKSGWLNK